MPRKLGYARVSTDEQDHASQLLRLKQVGVTRIFTDVITGKTMDRPGLSGLLKFARRGDSIVVVRLDRLGRNLTELLLTAEMLQARGISLESLKENIETVTATGEFQFHISCAWSHFERRLIAERTKEGLAAARAKGVRLGRPPKLDEKQLSAARRMLKKATITQVAKTLEVAPWTLTRSLRRAENQ